MKNKGNAIMGIGHGINKNRAIDAAESAINSHLLENRIDGSTGMLVNITAGETLGLKEIDDATKTIKKHVSKECNIIFGAFIDKEMGNNLTISVIATGFQEKNNNSFSGSGLNNIINNPTKINEVKTIDRQTTQIPQKASGNAFGNYEFGSSLNEDTLTPPTSNMYSNDFDY